MMKNAVYTAKQISIKSILRRKIYGQPASPSPSDSVDKPVVQTEKNEIYNFFKHPYDLKGSHKNMMNDI